MSERVGKHRTSGWKNCRTQESTGLLLLITKHKCVVLPAKEKAAIQPSRVTYESIQILSSQS